MQKKKKTIPEDVPILENDYSYIASEYEILNDRTAEGDLSVNLGTRPSISLIGSKNVFSIANKMIDERN